MEKKRRVISHILVGAFAVLLFFGCKPDEPQLSERVVLAYLIGDNNLDPNLRDNMSDMEKGMKGVNGKMVVYHDGLNEKPKLYLIDSEGKKKLLQELPEETNSCSPERLKEVLNYLFRNYPARSYGMILSSHGYGWVPYQTTVNRGQSLRTNSLALPKEVERTHPLTRHFGVDVNPSNPLVFEIASLASSFPQDRRFDFLFFDACFMASIESLYEMRNCSRYTLAAQAQVLAYGAPFHRVCKYLFMDNSQLHTFCEEYMDFYENEFPNDPKYHADGLRSAAISLIDNSQLESLAQSARSLLEGVTAAEMAAIAPRVQVCERERTTVFYDLGHFYSLLRPEKYSLFRSALAQAVVVEKHTETIFSKIGYEGTFTATNFTGLNCFIPIGSKNTAYNSYYYRTEWAVATGITGL